MYPIHSAQLRLAVIRLAANRAVDRAMRQTHDGMGLEEAIEVGVMTDQTARLLRAEFAQQFHERMKTDESNCRWCGLAAEEARAELENEDVRP
jgi:nitrate/TMAO reductase-like tetraheme cytochrome c subunit